MKNLLKISNGVNFSKGFFKKILFIILVLLIVVIGGIWAWKNQGVQILTDQSDYQNGGVIRLTIKNLLFKNVCFSSCYPYYLERREPEISGLDGWAWVSYDYEDCQEPDLVEKCIKSGEKKIFEINLPKARIGTHRISIPGCVECQAGGEFQEDKRFYSNEFEIK